MIDSGPSENEAFERWSEGFAARWVRTNPQLATTMQYFSGAEQAAIDERLALAFPYGDTIGASAAAERATLAREGLSELATRERASLGSVQRTSAALIEHRCKTAVAAEQDARLRFVFDQFNGLHVSLVSFLTTQHPLRDVADAERYVVRLACVAGLLDAGIAEAAEAQRAAGVVPPAYILTLVLAQLDDLLASAADDHVLATTLERRLNDTIHPAGPVRDALVKRARDIVAGEILPALGRVRAFVRTQAEASAARVAGVSTFPDYERFYRQRLAAFTGCTKSPREIHDIGLREVARIEAEMEAILRRMGHREGTLDERIAHVSASLKSYDGADARERIVLELRAIIDDAVRRSHAVFGSVPRAPVTVEREPSHSEATSAAHYTVAAADGSKPGIYWVPLAEVSTSVPWLGIGMKSTAYHEAVPGHHFQFALEQETDGLPHFRKRMAFGYDASFNEGWALYAEHLAAEFDWYADDEIGRLGYLEMQLFRARRLVVDTGLHAFGWTRARAIDYGLAPTEVDRYVVWPGQACAYMLGQLRIQELRERARTALGSRFSLPAFHDVLLRGGTVPLDVLDDAIATWTAEVDS